MNYKTVLIVIMSVVVILLSGYVVAMNMQNQDDETNMTQIRFADNGSTSFSIGNTSPERSVSHTRPPVNNNNNPSTGNTTPVDDGENNTQSS